MKRALVFLATALAFAGAGAQAPPISVPPVRIGPADDGGRAAGQQQPQRVRPPPPPAAPPSAPAPAPLSNCNADGCWDSQGNRYDSTGGNGSRLISPDGRLCQTRGQFIHCN